MSSYGEDIIRETFEKFGDAIGVQMQIPDAMIANLGAVLQAQIDLLAELQSTGRLIPAGGMALTAEQVEDVRTAREELRGYRNFTGYGRSHVNQLIAAVDALFPAAEPAEARCTFYAQTEHGDIQCELPDGHAAHHRIDPAPAEPSEEETKAQEFCCHPKCRFTDWGGSNRKHTRGSDCPIVPKPTSSPVVPAPTETEWQTCGHVPIGIVFRSKDRHPTFTWVNEGGSLLSVRNECEDGHFSDGEHCSPSMVDEHFAPFVAAPTGTGPWE
jgi:hypothetical protein